MASRKQFHARKFVTNNVLENCELKSFQENFIFVNSIKSKKEGKDQESIDTIKHHTWWESDNFTIRYHKREPRGQPFPSR